MRIGEINSKNLGTVCSDNDGGTITLDVKQVNEYPFPNWINFLPKEKILRISPLSGSQGKFSLMLVGKDDYGGSSKSFLGLTVLNSDPICGLLEFQLLEIGKQFIFTFPVNTCSDQDGDPLSYFVAMENGANLPEWIKYYQSNMTFWALPKPGAQNTYMIKITASDPFGANNSARLPLRLINRRPELKLSEISVLNASLGKFFNYAFLKDFFTDPDGDKLTMNLEFEDPKMREWMSYDLIAFLIFGTPIPGSQGEKKVRITADDGFGMIGLFIFTVIVENKLPVSKNLLSNKSLNIGKNFVYKMPTDLFYDPDGDTLNYRATLNDSDRLLYWLNFDEKLKTLYGTPTPGSQGVFIIIVLAQDGFGGEASSNFTLKVENLPPVCIKNMEDQNNLNVNREFQFDVPDDIFNDPDGDKLYYKAELENGLPLPPWIKFFRTTLRFSAKPTINSREIGTYFIRIIVDDNFRGLNSTVFKITLENRSPTCKSIYENIITIGIATNISLLNNICVDPDGDLINYNISTNDGSPLPNWVQFSYPKSFIVLQPISGLQGNHSFKLLVTDNYGGSTVSTLLIVVINSDPECKKLEDVLLSIGKNTTKYIEKDSCQDIDGDELFYDVLLLNKFPLPTWIKYDSNDNKIIVIPKTGCQGKTIIGLFVNDKYGGVSHSLFNIIVLNNNPSCKSIVIKNLEVGNEFLYQIENNLCYDIDGDSLSFTATLENGEDPPNWISFFPNNLTFYVSPKSGSQGITWVKFSAHDDFGGNFSQKISFNVFNKRPVVNFTQNPQYNISIGVEFKFNIPFTFYDPDGDKLDFSSEFIDESKIKMDKWITFDPIGFSLSGIAPTGTQGTKTVKIIAKDDFGLSSSKDLTINVENNNPKPYKNIQDQEAHIGKELKIILSDDIFEDKDGDTLMLKSTLENGFKIMDWLFFDEKKKLFQGLPKSGSQGDYRISIIATDGFGGEAFSNFTLKVHNLNPLIKKTVENYTNLFVGIDFDFQMPNDIFFDPDLDKLKYKAEGENGLPLPSWLKFRKFDTDLYFSGIPVARSQGAVKIKLTAEDEFGGFNSTFFFVIIQNRDPVCKTPNEQSISIGKTTNLTLLQNLCEDPDGDPLTIKIALENNAPLPNWIDHDEKHKILRMTAYSGCQGSYSINIFALDTHGAQFTAIFLFNVANRNPECKDLNELFRSDLSIGKNYNYIIPKTVCEDPDKDDIVYKIQQENDNKLDSWIEFNPNEMTFSMTPKSGSQGIHKLILTSEDRYGGKSSLAFQIKVRNSPPTVKTIPNQETNVGKFFEYTVPNTTFFDSDGDILIINASLQNGSGLMDWLYFNSINITFQAKPVSGHQGIYFILLVANDNQGGEVSTKFSLTIQNLPPKMKQSPEVRLSYFVGQVINYMIPDDMFWDPDGDDLSFSANLNNVEPLPSWIKFNPFNKMFTGKPPSGSQGSYNILISVTDPQGSFIQARILVEIPDRKIIAKGIPDQKFFLGSNLFLPIPSDAFSSEDGNKLFYNSSLEDGSPLPDWLKLSDKEAFIGSPTSVGTFKIKVMASDFRGGSAELNFSIIITAQPTSITMPKVVKNISDQNVSVNGEFELSLPKDLFSGAGFALTYSAKLFLNDDPLPSWLIFNQTALTFSGKPEKGDHINKTKIKVEAKNLFLEKAETSFTIEFHNRAPRAINSTINRVLLINQEYTIFIAVEDEDGDKVLCKFVSEKPQFIELDSTQCKCICSPQKKDFGYRDNITVIIEDGFGGVAFVYLAFKVEYSDFDNFMRFVNSFLPILSALGGILAAWKKRSLIWNIFAFWSRPNESHWNMATDKSFKILKFSTPGWFKEISFIDGTNKIPELNLTTNDLQVNEKLRKRILKEIVYEIHPFAFKKKKNIFDKLPFLDFLIRIKLNLKPLRLDWRDVSLKFEDILEKNNLLDSIGDDLYMKLLVFDYTGRVLEKITCEIPDDSIDEFLKESVYQIHNKEYSSDSNRES